MPPRVHFTKKASKDYPAFGIKNGEPYYWWHFWSGPKQCSKTPPTPEQLRENWRGRRYRKDLLRD